MRDDKFKELMEKYVGSTKRGEDVDFQKLRNRNEDRIKEHKAIPRYVWAICTVILVAVISLSIILPISLKEEETPQNYYCDILQTEKTEISEMAILKDDYDFSCLFPTIEFIDSYIYAMNNIGDNKKFGAFIDIAVFDENYDRITFNIIKNPYVFIQLQYYDAFTDRMQWRNTIVGYKVSENDNYYSYEMTFTIGNYNYFINFDSFSEMSVTEALDMIYN